MLALIRKAAGAALDLVYPSHISCVLCGADLDEPGVLCAECAERMPGPRGPACPGCGRSFSGGELCRMCRLYGPASDGGYAAYDYENTAQHLLLSFKFSDKTGLSELFAFGMVNVVREGGIAEEIGCVVPVPMHWLRKFNRGYNQSELLASRIAADLGRPLVKGVLARPVYTRAVARSSGGPAERHQNALKSFRPGKGALAGKTVLLVDDILTSGSTIRACASILRRMGATKIYSVVAAAVPE